MILSDYGEASCRAAIVLHVNLSIGNLDSKPLAPAVDKIDSVAFYKEKSFRLTTDVDRLESNSSPLVVQNIEIAHLNGGATPAKSDNSVPDVGGKTVKTRSELLDLHFCQRRKERRVKDGPSLGYE